jgi:acyl carrier protein
MEEAMNEVEQRVIGIVADYIGGDESEIGRDSNFAELGINSLDALDVLFQMEEEFDVSIPNEVAGKIRTIGEAIDGLESLLSGETTSPPQGDTSPAE